MNIGAKISKYLIFAVLPYFIFAWILLSVVLFVQQAGRFADIFFSANIPSTLVWQLTFALIPNVIAFTCPMAVLVGVIIGLTKMQTDNELTAIRAAGVSNLQITAPIFVLGIVLSVLAFLINLYGVPFAARLVRVVALQTAIYKLESPIEPGVFNTEVNGYTIYVKGGDPQTGSWKNIFVYSEVPNSGIVRLITSTSGRIDSTEEKSELVLNDAIVSTFTDESGKTRFSSENVKELRFAIQTRRGELIEKLANAQPSAEELGLSELAEFAGQSSGKEKIEAEILWQRRLLLSVTPLIFCLLGTAMILRFSSRGRGFGIVVGLLTLIGYYLLAFFGEQLARTGKIGILAGSILPLGLSALILLFFNYGTRLSLPAFVTELPKNIASRIRERRANSVQRRNILVDLTTGLRDLDLLFDLAKYFVITLSFLVAVFVIFTAFELWKFAGTIDGGIFLLLKYLLFLLPFIYIQLAPSSAMVAVLATYVVKSRQNEIVTWTSAGQSVYRLLMPCFIAMLLLGIFNWQVQDRLLPYTNRVQDEVRSQLRNNGIVKDLRARQWVAEGRRIYSFMLDPASIIASDNDAASSSLASRPEGTLGSVACKGICRVFDLTVFEFDADNTKLQHTFHAAEAEWDKSGLHFRGQYEVRTISPDGQITSESRADGNLAVDANPFTEIRKKPSHLSIAETREQISNSESFVERRLFSVALEKKYSTPLLPLVIALFTAPFALSLTRKGKVITVGYAVALWLVFMGVMSVFEQFGINGSLAPSIAVWAPLLIFTLIGAFLLSKVRT